MRFTIVNFAYLFYTIVKGFYLSKLLSVTSTNIKRIESMINSLLKRELRLPGCLLIQYFMAFMPSSWLMFVYKLVTSKETNIVLSGTVFGK